MVLSESKSLSLSGSTSQAVSISIAIPISIWIGPENLHGIALTAGMDALDKNNHCGHKISILYHSCSYIRVQPLIRSSITGVAGISLLHLHSRMVPKHKIRIFIGFHPFVRRTSTKEDAMQGKKILCVAAGGLAALAALLLWSGCATAPPANVKMVDCTGAKIQWEVAPEAEITRFDCALGTHAGDPSLIYTVQLKNASDKARRFKLSVYLQDMGKAVAYLVPRKGKPPQLAPSEEATIKIPFMKTTAMSKKTLIRVVPIISE
jgi:hypothetical protein